MRSCWIDHDQDVNIDLMRKHGVTQVVIPTRKGDGSWGNITASECEALANLGFKVTVFVAWNWFPEIKRGDEFAVKVDAELKRVGWPGRAGVNPGGPTVQVDIEALEPIAKADFASYILHFMLKWRELRKTRETDWTLDALQGGLFNGRWDAVQAVINAGVGILPQYYTGGEHPIAGDVALRDLLLYGFPQDRIKGFYVPAANGSPPYGWDGCIWRQGLLR